MGSAHWLYKMRVVHQGAPGTGPALVRNKADDFTTLRGMGAVGYALNLIVTRGLILEEASRGAVEMGSGGQSADGKITITGLIGNLDGTSKGYVVRESSWAATPANYWHALNSGEVANGGGTPSSTSFDYSASSQNRKASGTSATDGKLTGDSGGQWAPTPTWAVFYLMETTGTGDTDIPLDGKDTAINFKSLKYEGDAPAVAKTGVLYGAKLRCSSTPLAAFDVVAVLGAVNPITGTSTGSLTDATPGTSSELQNPFSTTKGAVAFNDTTGAGSNVSYKVAAANDPYFTMTFAAGTSDTFTTWIVPAPEDLAVLPTSAASPLSALNTLTLTAVAPGAFYNITKTTATAASAIGYPSYDAGGSPVATHLALTATVSDAFRGTIGDRTIQNKITILYLGVPGSLTNPATATTSEWKIAKGLLKRKAKTVTGAYSTTT
jgi:hypothetical protein